MCLERPYCCVTAYGPSVASAVWPTVERREPPQFRDTGGLLRRLSGWFAATGTEKVAGRVGPAGWRADDVCLFIKA